MIEIFPAIDLINGKTVRLREGRFAEKKEYPVDPVVLAREYEAAGFRNLHLVDLDGARTGRIQQLEVLRSIARTTTLHIDVGGGIRTLSDVRKVLDAGAHQVNVGSIAVRNPETLKEWILEEGTDRFIAAVDLWDESPVAEGWQQSASKSWREVISSLVEMGITCFSVTAVHRDGNLEGADMTLYKKIINEFSGIKLIGSGGVSAVAEIRQMDQMGVYGVIIGKALLEGKMDMDQLTEYILC